MFWVRDDILVSIRYVVKALLFCKLDNEMGKQAINRKESHIRADFLNG